jgi:Thiamine pyrophosphate enzyme, N-terminal TPP binding domain
MAELAAQALVSRLADWGVDTVFGLPGDGINGIMEGLRREQHRVSFVLVHHEEAAAFMATGYAKATGRLGGCSSTTRLSCRGWWTSRSAPPLRAGGRPPDDPQPRPGRRCRCGSVPARRPGQAAELVARLPGAARSGA